MTYWPTVTFAGMCSVTVGWSTVVPCAPVRGMCSVVAVVVPGLSPAAGRDVGDCIASSFAEAVCVASVPASEIVPRLSAVRPWLLSRYAVTAAKLRSWLPVAQVVSVIVRALSDTVISCALPFAVNPGNGTDAPIVSLCTPVTMSVPPLVFAPAPVMRVTG